MRLLLLLCTLDRLLLAYDQNDLFEKEVRPVLAKNCFACHSSSPLGNLAMTSREALRKGGNSGPAVTPGKPDESLLIQAVSHTHARLKMPPSGKLSDAEISALRKWIEEARYGPTQRCGRWPSLEASTGSHPSSVRSGPSSP